MTVAQADTSEATVLVEQIHALLDESAATDVSACVDTELVAVAADTERAVNRLMSVGNRQVRELDDRDMPRRLGFRSLVTFMTHRLRMSDPGRRRDQITALTPSRELTGELLPAKYPTLADAFASGDIGPAHIAVVVDVLSRIPLAVPFDHHVAAEQTMGEAAARFTPKQLGVIGARLLAHLDPDGEWTDDADRQRKRSVVVYRQNAQKMSKLVAQLTPMARARLDVVLAAWAKPGMNNPDDPDSPWGAVEDADPEQLAAAIDRDRRTPAQRNHDALNALLTAALEGRVLGQSHRGLPVQVVIKAYLSDLIAGTGMGVTASNSLVPLHDVVTEAAGAQQWLAVFDDHTEMPLYLGRAKRLATPAQRLMSFAAEGGEVCSHPDCDQPATQVESHHAVQDYATGGRTDASDLAPACPRHNRMVGERPGQYTTGIDRQGPYAGRCWWRPNSAPGEPENPKRYNALPDIAATFTDRLHAVREEITTTRATTRSVASLHDRRREHRLARSRWTLAHHQLPPPRQ